MLHAAPLGHLAPWLPSRRLAVACMFRWQRVIGESLKVEWQCSGRCRLSSPPPPSPPPPPLGVGDSCSSSDDQCPGTSRCHGRYCCGENNGAYCRSCDNYGDCTYCENGYELDKSRGYGNWRCVEAAKKKKKKNKKKSKSALSKEVKKLCKKAKGKSKCKKGIAKQYCTFNKKKSKCQPK